MWAVRRRHCLRVSPFFGVLIVQGSKRGWKPTDEPRLSPLVWTASRGTWSERQPPRPGQPSAAGLARPLESRRSAS